MYIPFFFLNTIHMDPGQWSPKNTRNRKVAATPSSGDRTLPVSWVPLWLVSGTGIVDHRLSTTPQKKETTIPPRIRPPKKEPKQRGSTTKKKHQTKRLDHQKKFQNKERRVCSNSSRSSVNPCACRDTAGGVLRSVIVDYWVSCFGASPLFTWIRCSLGLDPATPQKKKRKEKTKIRWCFTLSTTGCNAGLAESWLLSVIVVYLVTLHLAPEKTISLHHEA